MPHARKPKEKPNNQISSEKKLSKEKQTSSDNGLKETTTSTSQPPVKIVATVDGEKIQVQTRTNKNMNRPSVFIRLDSSEFFQKFSDLWKEHIEGFVGLRGSKRERSEKEKQMEWRKRVKELPTVKKHVQIKKSGQSVTEEERLLVVQRYRELMNAKKSQKLA